MAAGGGIIGRRAFSIVCEPKVVAELSGIRQICPFEQPTKTCRWHPPMPRKYFGSGPGGTGTEWSWRLPSAE